MEISDLLIEKQKSLFVGRARELAVLHRALSDPEWQLLNIHGPSGMGKTTLLRLFAHTIGPTRCFYFDGSYGFQRPEDFLNQVRVALQESSGNPDLAVGGTDCAHVANLLNSYARQQQGIVLLLDTFEQCGIIENWLRHEWFNVLSPSVKVCLAGRYALEDQWLRDGWNMFVQNIPLPPLSSCEVVQYAHTRGIDNRKIVNSLQRFSRGVPLALSMSCEIIIHQGRTSFLDLPQQKKLIGHLAEQLTKNIHDPSLRLYTEAASVVWRFDQELLQSILQEKIPTERFRDFSRLPFVTRQKEKWSLHDSVRQWTFSDLRNRMPQTFHDYRSRALIELRNRESAHPDQKAEWAFEKIYLHENDFVRDFCFHWDDSLVLRECRTEDLAQVTRLYAEHLHNQSNFIEGEAHLEPLIRPLWEINPAAFIGLWKEDQLVAFCSCIPLTEHTVRIFRDNLITAPIAARFDPGQRQCIICIAGVEPRMENEINGPVARAMTKIIDRNALIFDLLSMTNWMPYLSLLGFERLPEADSATPRGVVYEAYQLDLRTEDFTSGIERMFTDRASPASILRVKAVPARTKTKLPMEEAVKLVQRALKNFSRLPFDADICRYLEPLVSGDRQNMETERIAHQLQIDILRILQAFSAGTAEERRYYQILHYAYIQKNGTHEVVAEHLHMAVPTYYRHLRIAVRKLTFELINTTTE
ncbi:ATP-binding protein [Cohnella terricola]|uniref:ATP-binding protein n=1 Tax=Cohnella terricola TaxID=1289167 RepID=UPI001649022C|nr:ATP-binding protein [Cohnella terricola]